MKIDKTWHITKCRCGAFLMRVGGDLSNISDRYAFIEKTPRIRIRNHYKSDSWADYPNWAEGTKGHDHFDEDSRKWCEEALQLFGHELV